MSTIFKVGGPLTEADAAVYVEREADGEALRHLLRMDYLMFIDPRQQGKTSLIGRLKSHPSLGAYACLYVYFITPNKANSQEWYRLLGERLLEQLPPWLDHAAIPLPGDSAGWRKFLKELARQAQLNRRRIVIALDEISTAPPETSEAFFSTLRDVYNSRMAEPMFEHLTFILAGAYDPRDLIQDKRVSPFNIAHRVHLADFTLEQVEMLVSKGGWPPEQTRPLAQHIHDWTDGQPYLTQLLCSYLAAGAAPGDVDAAVERLRREDRNHLSPLLNRLTQDAGLHQYADRILSGARIMLLPGEDRQQAQLELLGIIKADERGYCRVRNRIYESLLAGARASAEESTFAGNDFRYDVFVSYSSKDHVWVRQRLVPYLERAGLRVCSDFRNFEIGVPILENIENAVQHSRKTLLVLTPQWLASEWADFEALLIQTRDPAGRARRILPLLVEPCQLPGRLGIFTYLDLTVQAEFDFQMRRLVDTLRDTPRQAVTDELATAHRAPPPAQPAPLSFSYERGLAELSRLLPRDNYEARLEFTVLEARLQDNLRDQARYGINDAIKNERARIVEGLNRVALTYLGGSSFNDLCRQ